MRKKGKTAQPAAENLDLHVTLQDMINGVEDDILVIDDEYRIRFANSAAIKRVQGGNESPIGQLCYKVLHGRSQPCRAPLWDCSLRKVLQIGRAVTIVHPAPPGDDSYLKITTYPIQDRSANTRAVVEMRRDVTAERELEAQIMRRHHQLATLSHISSAVSGLADLDTILRLALDNVLEIISGAIGGGILLFDEKTKTLSYRMQRGLPAKYTENRRIALGEGICGKVARTGESILVEDISRDPREARPDLVMAEGIKGFVSIPLKARDRVVGVMNVFSHVAGRFGADDVSLLNSIGDYLGTTIEQARLYERLARVGERYRTLLRHSLTAQEQERKRIASELHDETAQSLTSLTLSLQAIVGMAEMKGYDDPEFMEKLKKTHAYTVHAGTEIVKLMKELRPTLLDELGMSAAIHRYAKDTLQAHGIDVSADFIGTDQRFPSEVEVTLFRIAQGAIGNILEHSEAKNALIKLKCSDTECVLTIEDDGKGFDVNKLTRVERSGRGAGLFTMRERTSQLGGTGYVESQPGKGTKITAKIPLVGNVIDEEDKSADS